MEKKKAQNRETGQQMREQPNLECSSMGFIVLVLSQFPYLILNYTFVSNYVLF